MPSTSVTNGVTNYARSNMKMISSRLFPKPGISAVVTALSVHPSPAYEFNIVSSFSGSNFPEKKGSIVVSIGQYKTSGESHSNITGPFQEKNENHNFKFTYELKDGVYDIHSEVVEK